MKYIIEKGNEFYLKDSFLENIFINEYMAGADGEYVKVYVYARMYAQHGYPMDTGLMAQQLGMSVTHVEEAWLYWESVGAVQLKKGVDTIEAVKFLNLKERYMGLADVDNHDTSFDEDEQMISPGSGATGVGAATGIIDAGAGSDGKINTGVGEAAGAALMQHDTKLISQGIPNNIGRDASISMDGRSFAASTITPEQIAAEIAEKNQNLGQTESSSAVDSPLVDREFKELLYNMESLMGRPLSSTEAKQISHWKNDFKMDTNVIIRGVLNCLDMNKDNYNYIAKVIENWGINEIHTEEELEKHLTERNDKFDRYKRIMRALGFEQRNPTEQEKLLMDNWFNQMGFNIDKVLEACAKTAGIPKPNFNYVNKVLENWHKEATQENRNVNERKPVSRKVVREYMEYLRKQAEKEAEERKKEIYQRFPAIEEIDKKSLNIGLRLSKAMVGHATNENLKDLSNQLNELAEERAYILSANNYDIYYTEKKYRCDKCNDMGVTEMAAECSCMKQRTQEAELWQKEREIGRQQKNIIEQSMKK